jgi:NitT/TauT family transport system substrate-binding protein
MSALRIGHLSTFYHTAVILMARPDLARVLGCDVTWHLFGTGPDIVNAFGQADLDLAYIGLPPALIGMDRGIDITCIAGGHIEGTVLSGRSSFRAFPGEQDLPSLLGQFRGLRIGVPGKGSIHDVIVGDCLDRYGLAGEVEIVNFRWADDITEAAAAGDVQAAAGTPALAVALSRYADFKLLYPPSKIWPSNPSYGILVRRPVLSDLAPVIEKFLTVHEEATALLRNDPSAAARIIAGVVGFVDEAFVLDTLRISPKYCAMITDGYISSTLQFSHVLRRMGYIERTFTADEIFDTSLIRRIHPTPDHYGA